ncbi:MAG TPA: HD family hydrolase [Pyrinomonadaceae bacterium]
MLPALVELQRLKRLDRTGWSLRGLPNGTESVASHSFGVVVAAMFLADAIQERGVVVNTEKVLRMALLHDWAEARVGDLPKTATDYFGSEARRNAETAALTDMVGHLAAFAKYRELYDDYEQRESVEAKLVKAADVIDLLVQVLALERAGARGLDEFWEVTKKPNFQLEGVAADVVDELVAAILKARTEV